MVNYVSTISILLWKPIRCRNPLYKSSNEFYHFFVTNYFFHFIATVLAAGQHILLESTFSSFSFLFFYSVLQCYYFINFRVKRMVLDNLYKNGLNETLLLRPRDIKSLIFTSPFLHVRHNFPVNI